MRVLAVFHQATRTGAPRALLDLLNAIAGPDFEVVLAIKRDGPLVEELESFTSRILIEPQLLSFQFFGRLRRDIHHMSQKKTARSVIKKLRPDVVYANTVDTLDYVVAASRLGIPVVLHCHEMEPVISESLAEFEVRDLSEKAVLVANSEASRRALSSALRIPNDLITVMYEPIDSLRIQRLAQEPIDIEIPKDTLSIMACGSVVEWKGPDLWIDMAASLADSLARPARFVWIGAGPLLIEMRKRVSAMGLDKEVEFVGELDNPYPLLAKADVLTVPSRRESFGIVAAEAMVLGTPVVAFAVDGLPEVIGDAGIVVENHDAVSMAESVAELLTNSELRADLGTRASQRARSLFDVSVLADQGRKLLLRSLGTGKVR